MGTWAVKDGNDALFIVESLPDGRVSMHIPSPDPLVVTHARAEEIRLLIGAAISNAAAGQQP